jgi:hypothetical protein
VPPAKIREIMRNEVGTMFDADLLTIFFREVTRGRRARPGAAQGEAHAAAGGKA